MTHGTDTQQQQQHETPVFHPRSAFAWTLRGGEIASREAQRKAARTRGYDTPTFDPRGAFAWTLRGGEVAQHEQRPRRAALDLYAAAA